MRRMSGGAILVFLAFVVAALFLKNRYFEFDGLNGFAISAGTGAVGGLVGALIGITLFPKRGDNND